MSFAETTYEGVKKLTLAAAAVAVAAVVIKNADVWLDAAVNAANNFYDTTLDH